MGGDPDLPPPPYYPTEEEIERAFWANWAGWSFGQRRRWLRIRRGYLHAKAAINTYRAAYVAAKKAAIEAKRRAKTEAAIIRQKAARKVRAA
jgi:hypothetical protein